MLKFVSFHISLIAKFWLNLPIDDCQIGCIRNFTGEQIIFFIKKKTTRREVTEAIAILLIIIVEKVVAFGFLLKHCEPKCSQVLFLRIFSQEVACY
jgi:hypothetical protein